MRVFSRSAYMALPCYIGVIYCFTLCITFKPFNHHQPSAMRVLSRTFSGWWLRMETLSFFIPSTTLDSCSISDDIHHPLPSATRVFSWTVLSWGISNWTRFFFRRVLSRTFFGWWFSMERSSFTFDSCSIDDDFHYPSASAMRVFSRTFLRWERLREWDFLFLDTATLFLIPHSLRCKYSTTFDSCSIDDDFHYP